MGEELLLLRFVSVARCEQLVQYVANCISAKIGETVLFPDFAGSMDLRLHFVGHGASGDLEHIVEDDTMVVG